MNKFSLVLKDAMLQLNFLERISLEEEDYAYARGINRSKRVVESALVNILDMENDDHATNK